MKEVICRTSLSFIVLFGLATATHTQNPASEQANYPNELAALAVQQSAAWRSIRPCVSTKADVEQLLGKSNTVFSESQQTLMRGYDDDPQWRLIVVYSAEDDSIVKPNSSRVHDIRIEPKQRVSLEGTTFPSAFQKGHVKDTVRNAEYVTYDDQKYGLRYVLYANDSPEGRFHKSDLLVIIYGASEEIGKRYSCQ